MIHIIPHGFTNSFKIRLQRSHITYVFQMWLYFHTYEYGKRWVTRNYGMCERWKRFLWDLARDYWSRILWLVRWNVIGHGFYPLLAMVYKCFNIYLLRYRVYLECLQVQGRFGRKWWFWCLLEHFECRAAKTRQMSSYGWRPSQRYIELLVKFPMPPVWGQSASYSRSYARFTGELSVCLARGSCREEERMLIDAELLTLIDMDARMRAEHILWPI